MLRLVGLSLPVEATTVLTGLGIVGAAFAMSWGAEAAERDVPRALALVVVALLAVLPEYAVDVAFAWKAGADPAMAPYAVANMTGSNRLLLGLGWPTVVFVAWLVGRRTIVHLDRGSTPGLGFLGLATAYCFTLPLRAHVSLVDTIVLVALFTAYAVAAARAETTEPDLVGPAAAIGALPAAARRAAIVALFAYAAGAVAAAAGPFAEGLVHTGRALGIDEFLLVQWLAPLASEAPEFLVAVLLATRGEAVAALGLLVSSKINQWTLLIGSLPLAYSLGAGRAAALPLDGRQMAEVLLTAAQSVFGLGVLASLSLSVGESAMLVGLFATQLVAGGILRSGAPDGAAATMELFVFAGLYVSLGVVLLVRARGTLAVIARETLLALRAGPPRA